MKTLSLLSLPVLCLCLVAFVQPDFDGGKQKAFQDFLAEFEESQLPYSITTTDIRALAGEVKAEMVARSNGEEWTPQKVTPPLTRQYAEFLPVLKRSKFSRMPPADVIPVHRIEMEENRVAVIYQLKNYFSSRQNFEMAIFTKKGKLLDQKYLAGYNPQMTTSCSIDEAGMVIINAYQNVWKQPLNKAGIMENELVSMDIQSTQYFQITNEGLFTESKERPASGKASLN
ncbi:MAG: hypothetical protein AAGG75_28525 [Bacteroidota bacterium]